MTLTTQKFSLAVSLSLYHTHIGLLYGFNLGFNVNFLTSIPVTLVYGLSIVNRTTLSSGGAY